MSELQYPFVNVPPIIYNQPLATLHESSAEYEAYSNYQQATKPISSPATKLASPITFVPANKNGEMVAIQGTYFHPRQHILTNDSFRSPMKYTAPTKKTRCQQPGCDSKPTQQKPESNPELAKYYVAGLSVVGLVILYRFISRTQY